MSSSELEDLSDIDLLDEPEGEPSHLDKFRLEADSISLKIQNIKERFIQLSRNGCRDIVKEDHLDTGYILDPEKEEDMKKGEIRDYYDEKRCEYSDKIYQLEDDIIELEEMSYLLKNIKSEIDKILPYEEETVNAFKGNKLIHKKKKYVSFSTGLRKNCENFFRIYVGNESELST